jgi:hypothetical protein
MARSGPEDKAHFAEPDFAARVQRHRAVNRLVIEKGAVGRVQIDQLIRTIAPLNTRVSARHAGVRHYQIIFGAASKRSLVLEQTVFRRQRRDRINGDELGLAARRAERGEAAAPGGLPVLALSPWERASWGRFASWPRRSPSVPLPEDPDRRATAPARPESLPTVSTRSTIGRTIVSARFLTRWRSPRNRLPRER